MNFEIFELKVLQLRKTEILLSETVLSRRKPCSKSVNFDDHNSAIQKSRLFSIPKFIFATIVWGAPNEPYLSEKRDARLGFFVCRSENSSEKVLIPRQVPRCWANSRWACLDRIIEKIPKFRRTWQQCSSPKTREMSLAKGRSGRNSKHMFVLVSYTR